MKRILIANRGEIALRIVRACLELNLKPIVCYSEIDKNNKYVQLAHDSICIGPSSSKGSYLSKFNIINAALLKKVDAIHPGYGFLSENYEFSKLCEYYNIKFIGPNKESLKLMGNKSLARQLALNAGVPIVPGSYSTIDNVNVGLIIAKKIGFPIILKANGGGGGKGMRLVNEEKAFFKEYFLASVEAEKSFNDRTLYIEKYIENPKHIEVQIIGDCAGTLLHMWERDCSVQRRYQKVIEEAPATSITNKLRKDIINAALCIGRSCKYDNVGTVEFLVDSKENFYFIEMNTRLQVEHPVTEQLLNIDVVKEQIKLSLNEKLSYKQNDIKIYNHSIECRINAENPNNNFYPSPDKIKNLNIPGGFGLRVDTHVYSGYKIPSFYDSMIAKIISFNKLRNGCISILKRALTELSIDGVTTNQKLCLNILNSEIFQKNLFKTNTLDLNLNQFL